MTASNKLRTKLSSVVATVALMGSLLAACASTPVPGSEASAADTGHAALPTTTETAETTPAPSSSAPSAAPSHHRPSPSPSAPHASVQPPKPSPKPAARTNSPEPGQLKPHSGVSKPEPANVPDELRRLSWYYLKQGSGIVPKFAPFTKTFAADGQKAVWVGRGKNVYLTFDNGGPMGDTAKLLKTLDDNDVKATFFIAGYNLKAHPDFFKKLVADGQLVGNHTMTHTDFNQLTDDQAKKEIKEFETLYHKITGEKLAKIFRFPYGTFSKHKLKLVSDLGYTSVFWSTAMKDWVPRKNGAADSYKDIMANLHDGDIILMHQGSDDNIAALDSIIKAIKKEGYEFKLVTDLQTAG